jgi:NTP pyrophosphatase (non-canonical NTP hydrolase)
MKRRIIINWNDYQVQALSTAVFPLDRSVEYTVLGLVSEVGEMAEAYAMGKTNIWGFDDSTSKLALSEGADAFWYCAALADALDWRLQDVATGYDETVKYMRSRGLVLVEITRLTGNMAGYVKKAIRDNDGFLTPEATTKLHKDLWNVLWLLDNWCQNFGSSRHIVMVNNLNKLADRKARGTLKGSGNTR